MADSEFPNYPALASCLLIESRLGLRNELERDLKATDLFLEVKVAKSIASARISLEIEDIDCCILGSGVSGASLKEFLAWVKEGARSKDCALVAISEQNSAIDAISLGAHSHVRKPLTKAKLFDAVVRGVVAANENSAWRGIFESSDLHRAFDNETASPLFAGSARASANAKALETPWATIGIPNGETLEPDAVATIFVQKNFLFLPNGEPTQELREAAETVYKELFPHSSASSVRFDQFCRKAIFLWFEDAPLGGFKEATEQLRMRILQYRG